MADQVHLPRVRAPDRNGSDDRHVVVGRDLPHLVGLHPVGRVDHGRAGVERPAGRPEDATSRCEMSTPVAVAESAAGCRCRPVPTTYSAQSTTGGVVGRSLAPEIDRVRPVGQAAAWLAADRRRRVSWRSSLPGQRVRAGVHDPVDTFGLVTVLEAVIVMIWGSQRRSLPISIDNPVYDLPGGGVITRYGIAAIVVAAGAYGAVLVFLRRSSSAHRMRAAAENPGLASQLGIDINKIYGLSWALALMVATLGGVAFAAVELAQPGDREPGALGAGSCASGRHGQREGRDCRGLHRGDHPKPCGGVARWQR